MRRLCILLAFLLIFPTALTGCWDMKEINSRTYIIGLGMDSTENEDEYLFTFQRAAPAGIDSSADSNSIKYENISVTASSMAQAVRAVTLSSSQELSFTHLACVIIGSDLADGAFSPLLEYLLQQTDVRRQSIVAVASGTAQSLLSSVFLTSSSSTGIASMLEELDHSGGHKIISTLSGVSIAILTGRGYCLYSVGSREGLTGGKPGVSASDAEDRIAVSGAYIFSAEKLKGTIDADQADILRLFASRQNDGLISAAHESGKTVYFWIDRSLCSVSCDIKEDRLYYRVCITAYCSIADTGGVPTGDITADILEHSLKSQLDELLQLSQNGLGGTFLGLEDTVRKADYQWYLRSREKFDEYYSDASIELNVNCQLERSGVIN